MNRELKFRAWDGEKIRYDVTGFEYGKGNEMEVVFLNGKIYTLDVRNITRPHALVMQYTGLKDSNGKEIYEGDICKIEGTIEDACGEEFEYIECFEVSFIGGSFVRKDLGECLDEHITSCEIIGNIYENAELLKVS